jgi:hypothetical protein
MTEQHLGTSGPGSVVLELGEGIGALVLHTPPDLHGHEIEISPTAANVDDISARTHSLVRERHTANRTVYAAVYPVLPEGDYTVWREDGAPVGQVVIRGGHATQFRWPEVTLASSA